eukprot:gene17748-9420_t
MDAGFFRGTSADQDSRFADKEKKLIKAMRFESVLEKKVIMDKVNLDTIKPWVTKRITELLGMEDEVVTQFIFELLEGSKNPDPKTIQIQLTGFLQGKNARVFMGELWELLISAQENVGGIPTVFLEKKKEEIRLRKLEQDRINAHIRRTTGDLQVEADSTIPGPDPSDAGLTPAEMAAVKAQALKLAKESNPSAHDASFGDNSGENPITVLGAGMVTPKRSVMKDLSGYTSSPASTPIGRNTKPGWYAEHDKFVHISQTAGAGILLIGDSIINGLSRYHSVWSKYFGPLRALNFGIGGDRTQHVLWRVENGEIPMNLHICVVHCGTNNIDKDTPSDITDGITSIVSVFQTAKPNAKVIIAGLLPRDLEHGYRRHSIRSVNKKLKRWSQSPSQRNVYFLKPDNDWVLPDGMLRTELYYTDYLHLGEPGNEKFAKSIYDMIMKLMQGERIDYILSSDEEDMELEDSDLKYPVTDLRDKLNNKNAIKTTESCLLLDFIDEFGMDCHDNVAQKIKAHQVNHQEEQSVDQCAPICYQPINLKTDKGKGRPAVHVHILPQGPSLVLVVNLVHAPEVNHRVNLGAVRVRILDAEGSDLDPVHLEGGPALLHDAAPGHFLHGEDRVHLPATDLLVGEDSHLKDDSHGHFQDHLNVEGIHLMFDTVLLYRRIARKPSYSSSASSRSPTPEKKAAVAKANSPSPPPTHRKDAKEVKEAPARRSGRSSSEGSAKERSKSPAVVDTSRGEPESYHRADKAQTRMYRTKRSTSSSISPEKDNAEEKRGSAARKPREKRPSDSRADRRSRSESPRRRRSPPRGVRNRSPYHHGSPEHRPRRRSPPQKSPPRRFRRESPPRQRRYRSPSESPPRRAPRRVSPSPRRRSPTPPRRQSPIRRRRDASPSPRRPPRRPSPPRRRRSPSEDWSASPSPPPKQTKEKRRGGESEEDGSSSEESVAEAKGKEQKRERRKHDVKKKEKERKRKRSPSPASESESEEESDQEPVVVHSQKKAPKRVVTVRKRTPPSSESEDESEEDTKTRRKKAEKKKDESSEEGSESESDERHKKKHRHHQKEKRKTEKIKHDRRSKEKLRQESSLSPERPEPMRKKRKKEPSESEKIEKKRRPDSSKERHGRSSKMSESPARGKKERKPVKGESEASESEEEAASKPAALSPDKRKRRPEREASPAGKSKRKGRRKGMSESEESDEEQASEEDRRKRKGKRRTPEKSSVRKEEKVDNKDEEAAGAERHTSGESDIEAGVKDKKKKKHRKHKKTHSHGTSKHKKRKHKKHKETRKGSEDEEDSEASASEEESAELEKKLRERALQSMQRRQKQSSESSSD